MLLKITCVIYNCIFYQSSRMQDDSEDVCFITFQFRIGNTRLKLAKNYPKAKQHPEAERSLFENY